MNSYKFISELTYFRDNTFEECGYNSFPDNYIIDINPQNHLLISKYYVHKNICIENNIFKVYDYPLLSARSTNRLSFVNNEIVKSDFIQPGKKRPAFNFTACTNVKIANNKFPENTSHNIYMAQMSKSDIKSDIKLDQ